MTNRLADAILSYCVRGEDGAEAISFIHRSLQQDGWKGLGNLSSFERMVQDLGFTVRQGRNRRGNHRVEVTL